MNKVIKKLIIAFFVCVALFFIPRIILQQQISAFPDREPVRQITDYSLKDAETYKVEKGNVIVHIPTYYNNCQDVKELSSYICDAHIKNKQLMVVYRPFSDVADKIIPGNSEQYREALEQYENYELPFPVSLVHEPPSNIYDAVKETYLADKNDYNFWNLRESIYLHYLLSTREECEKTGFGYHSIYKRDDICAFVVEDPQNPGSYAVMILPEYTSIKNLYIMMIQTSDTDDITKILNTYEFK